MLLKWEKNTVLVCLLTAEERRGKREMWKWEAGDARWKLKESENLTTAKKKMKPIFTYRNTYIHLFFRAAKRWRNPFNTPKWNKNKMNRNKNQKHSFELCCCLSTKNSFLSSIWYLSSFFFFCTFSSFNWKDSGRRLIEHSSALLILLHCYSNGIFVYIYIGF